MAHKSDVVKAKKRRILYWVLAVAGATGYFLVSNLIVPTTSLEEDLVGGVQILFLLDQLIALGCIILSHLAELIDDVEHPQCYRG